MLSIQTLGIAILLHNQNLSRKVDNSCRHSIPTAVDSTKLRQIQVVISQNPPVFWLQQPGCKSSACVQCLRGASCNNASNFQVNKNYERCWKGKGTGKPALVIKIWNRAIEKTCLKYEGTEKSALALAQLYQTKDSDEGAAPHVCMVTWAAYATGASGKALHDFYNLYPPLVRSHCKVYTLSTQTGKRPVFMAIPKLKKPITNKYHTHMKYAILKLEFLKSLL